MKKIIHLMSTNDYSGAEKVVIDIINGLKNENEYELIYVTPKGKINEILEERNIKYINIEKLSIKEVRRITKKYKPSIIHAHDYRASLIAAFSFVKVPIISHLHNNSPWIQTLHPYSFALLLAGFRIQKILTVSASIEKEYIFAKFIKKKIESVGNPVSIHEITDNIPKELKKKYDICFSGRLTKQKNPIKFITIIYNMKNRFPKIRAVMLGSGELKEKCIKEIKRLGLEENIELKGFVKNPYIIMAQSKIFCLTSDWEGFGLVAFEALALGLPCVVSEVGGLIDIVNEKCGKLCSNKEEFIKEINNLMSDKSYYDKKSKNAIKEAKILENFDEYMDNIKNIYNKFLEEKDED